MLPRLITVASGPAAPQTAVRDQKVTRLRLPHGLPAEVSRVDRLASSHQLRPDERVC